jgi:hypothetical protein
VRSASDARLTKRLHPHISRHPSGIDQQASSIMYLIQLHQFGKSGRPLRELRVKQRGCNIGLSAAFDGFIAR